MPEEKTVSSKRIYDGRVVSLRVDTIEAPGGRRTTREIVEHAECVAIVALDADGNVILVRQFRKAVGKPLLEIPAGGVDPGENPEDCVRREMQEETGFYPQKVEKLGGFYAAPGYCTEYLHLYLATDLKPGRLIAEDTEEIEVVRMPLKRALGLVKSGEVCDGKSIAGLLFFSAFR